MPIIIYERNKNQPTNPSFGRYLLIPPNLCSGPIFQIKSLFSLFAFYSLTEKVITFKQFFRLFFISLFSLSFISTNYNTLPPMSVSPLKFIFSICWFFSRFFFFFLGCSLKILYTQHIFLLHFFLFFLSTPLFTSPFRSYCFFFFFLSRSQCHKSNSRLFPLTPNYNFAHFLLILFSPNPILVSRGSYKK